LKNLQGLLSDTKLTSSVKNGKKMVKLTFGSTVPLSSQSSETSDYDSEHQDSELLSAGKYPQIVRLHASSSPQRTVRFIKFNDESTEDDSGLKILFLLMECSCKKVDFI